MEDDLVTVATFNSSLEAEVARGLLEIHNIKSMIVIQNLGASNAFPTEQTGGVELKVRQQDKSQALQLLSK